MEDKGKTPKAHLIIQGQIFPLQASTINLGRKLNNHVVIDDKRVSRLHAQIRVIDNAYYLVDLNSTGGTFVNEKRINHTRLFGGDIISFSGFEIKFTMETGSLVDRSEDYTVPSRAADLGRLTEPGEKPDEEPGEDKD